MELPPEKKPSLEDLFNSKRYDQPNLEFWENFQDEFRSKALTSVVKSNNSLKSAMKYSSCFVILAMFANIAKITKQELYFIALFKELLLFTTEVNALERNSS